MDAMILGTTLPFENGSGFSAFSFWIPRQGDTVRFNVDVAHSLDVKLTIQTKNREDAESAAIDLGDATVTGGALTLRVTGGKELIRVKLTTNPNDTATDSIVHLRVLDPVWER